MAAPILRHRPELADLSTWKLAESEIGVIYKHRLFAPSKAAAPLWPITAPPSPCRPWPPPPSPPSPAALSLSLSLHRSISISSLSLSSPPLSHIRLLLLSLSVYLHLHLHLVYSLVHLF